MCKNCFISIILFLLKDEIIANSYFHYGLHISDHCKSLCIFLMISFCSSENNGCSNQNKGQLKWCYVSVEVALLRTDVDQKVLLYYTIFVIHDVIWLGKYLSHSYILMSCTSSSSMLKQRQENRRLIICSSWSPDSWISH